MSMPNAGFPAPEKTSEALRICQKVKWEFEILI